MAINGSTKLYGILGHPVGHSLSPVMHNAALAAMGINGVYIPMDVTDIRAAVSGLRALGFIGVSVTIPHKEEVMGCLDEIDPVAQRIGAVNTLLFRQKPGEERVTARGFNTDWLGANLALAEKIPLTGSRVLVIGAGGAAKGVCFGLVEAGAEVVITNRTKAKGQALADWLGCSFIPSDQVGDIHADALINTTSVGMEPDVDGIAVAPALLDNFSVVMDIVYAPLTTRLLREAEKAGCQTIDGLSMLLFQAAVQLKIWTGEKPPQDVMRRALVEELRRRKAS
ncbi:MAG TPA: shikimate dehydrogenase [Desulfobulbaceae bacterium]|nr:shikimate dehydrogenase [Desulfobulbaceae bacterium]HHD64499.1 shikimate dehydrogenase [Desulfobulbaceae bacterium]